MQENDRRNAALDGVRALAVSAVLLFHGGVSWAQGGFLGVDLFFVLSGFLITGLLLAEHQRYGRVSLRAFWSRRARRLLPALLVLLLVVLTTVGHHAGGLSQRLRGDVLATLGQVANWRLSAQSGDYFAQQADPSPLEHTWSLSVEGQFYLVWPLLVIGLLAIAHGRRALLSASILLVAGTLLAGTAWAVQTGTEPTALYYRSDTRAPALLLGALLAVATARRTGTELRSSARVALGLVGVLGLAGSAALWHLANGSAGWLYQGGLLGAALASVSLVASAALHPGGLVGRFLGLPPLRVLGLISYGVYLWHWPVYLALTAHRTGLHGPALLAFRIATTLELAGLSWLLIERPVRRMARVSLVAVPVALAACLAATVVVVQVPVPPVLARPALASSVSLVHPATKVPRTTPQPRPTRKLVAARPVVTPQPRPGPVHRTPAPISPAAPPVPRRPLVPVDVLGDSVADSLGSGLEPVDEQYGARVTNRGIVGCGIAATSSYRFRGQTYGLADRCRSWESEWAGDVARDRPQVVLVVVGRHEVWDAELDGRWTNVGQADFDAYLAKQLDRAIEIGAARGARVAMATTPYFHGPSRPDGGQYPENDPKRVDRFNVLLRAAVTRHAGKAFVVDLNHEACPDGHYTSTVHGVKIRKDGVHFTAAGARYLAPWLMPRLVG